MVTDEQGKVTITGLEPRDTPYFITAEKLEETADGGTATLISAAYSYITVLLDGSGTESCLDTVTLHLETEKKEKDISLNTLDGSQAFIVPAEMVYLNSQPKGKGTSEENHSRVAQHSASRSTWHGLEQLLSSARV